jgi:hypothetical protein
MALETKAKTPTKPEPARPLVRDGKRWVGRVGALVVLSAPAGKE